MVTNHSSNLSAPESDYSLLSPIGGIIKGYSFLSSPRFNPHEDYPKKGYLIEHDLVDNIERCKITEKLNQDIRDYNKWAESKDFYKLDELNPWMFFMGKTTKLDDYPSSTHDMYFVISDEELYKSKEDDPDFVPRFNKTIYDYIKLQKQSAEEDGRWDKKNIWYQPFRIFGDWFDKNPSDAKPYQLGFYKTDVTDSLYIIVDDLTIDVCDKGTKKYRTLVDACEWWCERHTHKGENKTAHQLTRAFYKAHSEGKL